MSKNELLRAEEIEIKTTGDPLDNGPGQVKPREV